MRSLPVMDSTTPEDDTPWMAPGWQPKDSTPRPGQPPPQWMSPPQDSNLSPQDAPPRTAPSPGWHHHHPLPPKNDTVPSQDGSPSYGQQAGGMHPTGMLCFHCHCETPGGKNGTNFTHLQNHDQSFQRICIF